MAKSASACENRTFQNSSLFSESEIDVAIQLVHLSEDSDNQEEISGCTSCSDDKPLASASASATSAKSHGGMEEDDDVSQSRHGGGAAGLLTTAAAMIGDNFEETEDGGPNRRRRKRRSRSVYEIYKLTKPVISVK